MKNFWLKGFGAGCAMLVLGAVLVALALLLSFWEGFKNATSEAQIRDGINLTKGGTSNLLGSGGIVLLLLGVLWLVGVPILAFVRGTGIVAPKNPPSGDNPPDTPSS